MAGPLDLVVVANPANRRLDLFQRAVRARGWPTARVVAHADLLAGRTRLEDHLGPQSLVRIESTGEDHDVECRILSLGGLDGAMEIPPERGRVLHPAAWLRGFELYMGGLAAQGDRAGARWFNHPTEIVRMFDKPRCKEHLGALSPPTLGRFSDSREFLGRLEGLPSSGVFVKLPGGSSASGVAAFRWQRRTGRQVLRTTLEMRGEVGHRRFYNSLRPQVYRDPADIAAVLDFLFSQEAFVEPWIAKPLHGGKAWDLRILGVAGRARHRLARLSRGPMTNLHLGNERLDPAALDLSADDWSQVEAVVASALARFPESLYAGLDVVVQREPERPTCAVVLEANAFGDLLPGLVHEGRDPWEAQLEALERRESIHG